MDVVRLNCEVCLAGIVLANHPDILDGELLHPAWFPRSLTNGWSHWHFWALDACRKGHLTEAWLYFSQISNPEGYSDALLEDKPTHWNGLIYDVDAFIADMEDTVLILKAKEDETAQAALGTTGIGDC